MNNVLPVLSLNAIKLLLSKLSIKSSRVEFLECGTPWQPITGEDIAWADRILLTVHLRTLYQSIKALNEHLK